MQIPEFRWTREWLYAVAYGNGRFVTTGSDGVVAYSTDGTAWTVVEGNPLNGKTPFKIMFGGGKFLASTILMNGRYLSELMYSEDGEQWTVVPGGTGAGTTQLENGVVLGIAYGAGKYIACGNNRKMAYSLNGIDWTPLPNTTVGGNIAYGDRKFVAIGESAEAAYSNAQE